MKRGDVKWDVKGPILSLTWMDKKPVQMTGTYSKCPGDVLPLVDKKKKNRSIESVPCQELVVDYNKYMGGVDRNDQMKSYYTKPVAGKKMVVKIFL